MNAICLTGNLCKDLKLEYTKNGKEVLSNTIAVQKGIKNKETGEYDSDFIDFVVFEKKATFLNEYAKRGDKIEITGKLRVDNWRDDKDEYHTRTYVVADTVNILSRKSKTESKEKVVEQSSFEITDEDLPF